MIRCIIIDKRQLRCSYFFSFAPQVITPPPASLLAMPVITRIRFYTIVSIHARPRKVSTFAGGHKSPLCMGNYDGDFIWFVLSSVGGYNHAAHIRLRIRSGFLAAILPMARVFMIAKASAANRFIFFIPRTRLVSNPNDTSSLLLTRSTAVLIL